MDLDNRKKNDLKLTVSALPLFGSSDGFESGVNGIVLPDIQPASIASKLQMLESDRTTLLAMKARASEFASASLTQRGCAETLSHALRALSID